MSARLDAVRARVAQSQADAKAATILTVDMALARLAAIEAELGRRRAMETPTWGHQGDAQVVWARLGEIAEFLGLEGGAK